MNLKFSGAPSAKAVTAGMAWLLLAPVAHAAELVTTDQALLPAEPGDFALKVEPGVAIPLTEPQSQIFKTGGGETIKALWTLNRYVDLGPSVTYMALPARASLADQGTAWTFGGSLRVKRPHDVSDGDGFHALSPWFDADALYVRTGQLNRPGFAVAAGLSAPIGQARALWLGPFVRYLQIFDGARAGFDSTDAKILSLGVSLEIGSGVRRQPRAVVIPAAEVRTVTVNKEILVCPDRDNDQVPDQVDRCPDVAGPMDNWGCPQYKKIVVQRDKLELKEQLYFAWNQATLQEISFPVLDEVVQALKDNKGFRVQVEGHTSSEGGDEHNQTLSEQRAQAVLDYLVAHGIAKDRLVSKGFAATVPIDTNSTVAGRENNRRVDFVVHFLILNDGSK
jgi:outer membrane protein OmpA-like peptidoglycan-associated protein